MTATIPARPLAAPHPPSPQPQVLPMTSQERAYRIQKLRFQAADAREQAERDHTFATKLARGTPADRRESAARLTVAEARADLAAALNNLATILEQTP